MSDVHAQEVTILCLGGSSGTLELVGVQDQTGWRFQVRTNEAGLLDEDEDWQPPPRPWVRSWHEALDQLACHPWRRLIPLHVEPTFRAQIVGAFLGADTTDRHVLNDLQDILHQWMTVLASPGQGRRFGADPSRTMDSS